MEKLLKIAESKGCRAEVYSLREKSVGMSKVNGAVSEVSASIQYGVSLRIIKDGKLGFAYTKNLNQQILLRQGHSLADIQRLNLTISSAGEEDREEDDYVDIEETE